MKKLFAVLIAVIVCLSCFSFVGCTNRSEILKLYMPGEYIDDEIFEEFEQWYFEETGKTVKVDNNTPFDEVEQIMTAVEYDHADYDLLCPSDYMVEQLINKGYLLKIDKERVDVSKVIKEEYVERAKISDPTLEYSVPYMYGTFGIVYNYELTGHKHIDSWDAIFTDEYKGVSANKDSLREAMSSAAIWANKDALKDALIDPSKGFIKGNYGEAFQNKIQDLYEDFSENAIEKARAALAQAKSYNKIWGGEDLKFNMASGASDIQVALMWSCDAGYIMNDYEDDNGDMQPGNRNLWYVVPKEGGNIYLDNFVISKYAKNVEAAQYFLEFICKKEIAIANSIYAGAISPVTEAYDELYEQYTTDPSYAEESGQEWRDMYIDLLFPSEETLARCGTMRDYGEADQRISMIWNEVKF